MRFRTRLNCCSCSPEQPENPLQLLSVQEGYDIFLRQGNCLTRATVEHQFRYFRAFGKRLRADRLIFSRQGASPARSPSPALFVADLVSSRTKIAAFPCQKLNDERLPRILLAQIYCFCIRAVIPHQSRDGFGPHDIHPKSPASTYYTVNATKKHLSDCSSTPQNDELGACPNDTTGAHLGSRLCRGWSGACQTAS